MARLLPVKPNFTNGEVDPLLEARSDIDAVKNGAALMRNVLAFAQGGFKRRGGLEFMDFVPPGVQVKAIGVVHELLTGKIGINAGGSGYVVGDDLTLSGGTGVSTKLRVESVNAGVITGIILIDSGDYTSAPTSPAGVSGGSGTGATFDFDEEIHDVVFPLDFTFSVGQSYLIIFTISRFYIFRAEDTGSGTNQLVEQGLHPYSNKELEEITWTQSKDIMLVLHENHPTFQLTRTEETVWTWDTFEIINSPTSAFAVVQTAQINIGPITINTQTGDTVVIVADSPIFTSSSVTKKIRIFGTGSQDEGDITSYYEITAFNTTTSVDAIIRVNPIVLTDFDVNGDKWLLEETAWTQEHGYPRGATLFQGRLCMIASTDQPSTLWTSRAGDINDFNNGGVNDDLGIQLTANTTKATTFQAIYPLRFLQILADSSEYYIPITEFEPLTPTNAALRNTTEIGSAPGIPPFSVDGVVYFLQRGGKSLRELVFTDEQNAIDTSLVSVFSGHLIKNPRDVALKKSLSTEDGNYVWFTNKEDGSLTALNILRSHKINAWTNSITRGSFHHVAVLDQTTYFHIQRTIDGALVDYIEFFNEELFFDAGAIKTNLPAPVAVVNDLDFLEGETVDIFIDDIRHPLQVVSGGSLTLPVEAQDSYQLGIPFPNIIDENGNDTGQHTFVKTFPSDIFLKIGTIAGKKKRISEITVRYNNTQTLRLQGVQVPFRNLPDVLDVPIAKQTGEKRIRGFLGRDTLGQITIGQKEPGAMKVLSVAYTVSTAT